MTDKIKKKNIKSGESAALRLYSHNTTCYNPDCNEPLLTERDGMTIVNHDIAHIRDELPPSKPDADIGWRYYPDDLTQDQRNTISNFLMLCAPCHKLIDRLKPRNYPVELLNEWKKIAEGDQATTSTIDPITPDKLLDAIQLHFTKIAELENVFDSSMVTSTTVGINPIKTPSSFPNRPNSREVPDKSTQRATTSWPPFYGATCGLITFEINNYTKHPIHEVQLKIDWQDRTYWMSDIVKVPVEYERVSKFYYQKTEDMVDMEDSIDWFSFRHADDILRIPHIAPNASKTIKLHRIVQRLFHKKPRLTLTFKDNYGNNWRRSGNDTPEKIKVHQ